MQRLLVVLLAALDAAIAAAVGLVVLLAPLTLLWTFAFGATADWGALWPASATLWQFGHGVPVEIALAPELLVAAGIPQEAAAFTLSVTPLALLLFTLLFAARSGVRAARNGAGLTGALSGSVVFAALSVLIALTGRVDAAATDLLVAVVLPTAVYLAGGLAGAISYAWREGDDGPVDAVHDAIDRWGAYHPVPAEVVRGTAIVVVALVAVAGLALAGGSLVRGGEIVVLYQRAHVDALGATIVTLGQLAYLPTLLVWAISWLAGPGFALGTGTAVSPVGTDLGVIPGIPVLGLIPEGGSVWMLVVVLIPVAAGAVAGWVVRSRLVWEDTAHGWQPRAAIAGGIAAVSAGVAALAAALASGSVGPGRLAEVGPHPGWFALAIGVEVLIGAGILLLSPRNRDELAEERTDRWAAEMGVSPYDDGNASDDGAFSDGSAASANDETAEIRMDEPR